MIVVMKNGVSSEEIAETVERIKALGLKPHVIEGTERTVVAAIGEKREEMKDALELSLIHISEPTRPY